MRHDDIASLQRLSPAWKLLSASNAPLVLSFLGRVFIDENVREISETDLVGRLDDELYALAQQLGPDAYPRTAKQYLADWSSTEARWLRKYYLPGDDEPRYDATQAVERAVAWVKGLRERDFVGTESRLNTVFDLLRQIVHGSDADPDARLVELRRRRLEIDEEIAATERGEFTVLDPLERRDRFQQFAETARALLSDFREVEANLRDLDRQMRERIATWDGTKGELLDEFVGNRSGISASDQGRSLKAFYDLLLTSDRLAEMTRLIAAAATLDGVDAADERLTRIHYDWLAAAKRAQDTVGALSEQLRSFLDDQVWLENRRVMDLLHSIETTAVSQREDRSNAFSHEIDALGPDIKLPMERPLYRKPVAASIDSSGIEAGVAEDVGDALFEQNQVDPAPLIDNVRTALRRGGQTTLAQVVADAPLERGLEELLTYFHLDDGAFDTRFDDTATDAVAWVGADGIERTATLPRVIYARTSEIGAR
ncbi:MAG: DUF3375 domain-containing protein [Gordonia sp. (in: high G+C Gram-positive bacteria)]|uniref:DUF3375 domain-containing protein n=1 Tax=Gordonia sp. (in: high G+C Gram-positive bacteria) TaxID=84139 RepID=UPI0039E630E6